MTAGQEGILPRPSLDDLVNGAVQRFNGRTLDESGFNVYHLDRAVIDTMTASGIDHQLLLSIAQQGSYLDSESLERILAESQEFDPKHAQLVATGRIIIEEILNRDPSMAEINERRIAPFRARIIQGTAREVKRPQLP